MAKLNNQIIKTDVIMAPVLLVAKPKTNKAMELRMPKSAKAILGINVIIKK